MRCPYRKTTTEIVTVSGSTKKASFELCYEEECQAYGPVSFDANGNPIFGCRFVPREPIFYNKGCIAGLDLATSTDEGIDNE